jgi:hypothetical protein
MPSTEEANISDKEKRRQIMSDLKLNRDWHQSHKMPSRATLEQRLQWHWEHAKNCRCRPIPVKIAEEMKKRGQPLPGLTDGSS